MREADFKRGSKGYIIYASPRVNPKNISIEEVTIQGHYGDFGYITSRDLGDMTVAPSDVFYNRNDAKKHLLSFLSKMHQKFMLEVK